ncbi:Spermidine/putrescine import ATP-binding protein PotA [Usitatibacter rugosus]|uniref:Spermidine/putrescine import ATP-binding protein PotA n=1 Tax=Usitatibacter rugosus TaxID=2732067 RepID=A0A6M4GUA0_9PROT|nr:ABC transporter ATP-binding protein [Usitatibacter rugosus]QJR10880.1 Spermidine/putrescine import ATP-binding protein PotA [Usitatibacter rugosus]
MPFALDVESISFSYPGSGPVADGFTLRLEDGEIGCLLGPSGCGKTTVLRCVAGLEAIDAGEIRLHGAVVSRPGMTQAPETRRVGVVFQDYALFPHLTVEGNVAFGLRGAAKASRAERVRELLAAIGLEAWATRYPHELSGGQKQRVALARALAPRPQLLLLDEPFSNLDVDLRERLSLEVRSILKAQGMTALLVTHDQHEAFAMADAVGVMRRGRVEQWDTAYNLYHRPATRFVADFVGEGVLVDSEVDGQPVSQLLRPDDVLHDDESPVKGEVLKKAFRGAEFLYTLRLDDGKQVLSLVPSHHNHAIGERIGVKLDVDHVVAFPRLSGSDD